MSTIIHYVLAICLTILPVSSMASSPLTSWTCTPHHKVNVTCAFTNMYVLNSTFTVQALLKTDAYQIGVESWALSPGGVFSADFRPHVIRFDTEEEAQSFLFHYYAEQHKTLYINPIWHGNFGHGLFDGLYPAYVGLIELGLHKGRFDILA